MKERHGKNRSISEIDYRCFIVCVFCSAIFILIYGIYILDPCYIDWIESAGDLKQHYLGWRAYRESPWHFPLGMMDGLTYPYTVSMLYTDSIPLLAVVFKLISPILPDTFQYFGWYGLFCYVLQGVMAYRILKRFTGDGGKLIIASSMFALMPPLVFKMFGHTALASQWIILFALEPIFAYEEYEKKKGKMAVFTVLLGVIASSIHMYYLLMCGIILCGFCILDIIYTKKIFRSIAMVLGYILIDALFVWIWGGFDPKMESSGLGLGIYSFNLNGFVNPQEKKYLLPVLPLYSSAQFEGFCYAGLGIILVAIIAMLLYALSRTIRYKISAHAGEATAVIFISATAVIFGASPVVTFGNKVIFQWKLPEIITDMWAIFRASGRIAWVALYVISICAFAIILKFGDKKVWVTVMLILCFIAQFCDVSPKILQKHDAFATKKTWISPIGSNKLWKAILDSDRYKHIVLMFGADIDWLDLADVAMDNGITLNRFYLARTMDDAVCEIIENELDTLPEEDLFIFPSFPDSKVLNDLENDYPENLIDKLHFYEYDKVVLGTRIPIEGFGEIKKLKIPLKREDTIQEGELTEEGCILYPGGISFGPYWSVQAGKYQITIDGDGLSENTEISITSDSGQTRYSRDIVDETLKHMVVETEIGSDVNNWEICISNKSDHNILIDNISIKRID